MAEAGIATETAQPYEVQVFSHENPPNTETTKQILAFFTNRQAVTPEDWASRFEDVHPDMTSPNPDTAIQDRINRIMRESTLFGIARDATTKEVVGFQNLIPYPTRNTQTPTHEYSWITHHGRQSTGIATSIAEKLFHNAQQRGIPEIVCTVQRDNSASTRLAQSLQLRYPASTPIPQQQTNAQLFVFGLGK